MNKQQQVIIFDGPDMVGKTEMAKELSSRLNIPYFKNKAEWSTFENKKSVYFINTLRYSNSYFFSFLHETKTSVILDRSYPSEWVYSKVYNRETDHGALELADKFAFDKLNAKIIVPFRTSYEGIKDDMHDIDSNMLSKISKEYENFLSWTKCDTLHLCVDSEDLDYEMFMICNFVKGKTV
jgi:thymidylate kinase